MPEIIRDPSQVVIYDTTLRDGAQMPRIDFDLEDRIVIVGKLAQMGVDVIEAGFPFAVEGDFEAARAIAESVDGPTISALSRTRHSDIEAAWDAIEPASHKGGARIHTFIGTSDSHMEALGISSEAQLIEAVRSGIQKATEYTDDIEFSPEDASRTPFNRMLRVVLEAVDAGATTINIPDTVGFAVMQEYAQRIKVVKEQIEAKIGKGRVVVSAHCHDDLGWATANTMMAIAAGARQAEVTIGGIGERASNACEEEVVANIEERGDQFGGVYTNVDTSQLTPVYKEVMDRAGLPIQLNKAVVGRNAFAHEAGIHQHKMQKDRETYEHMDGEEYGQVPAEMVLGKLSGWRGVESRLKDIGITANSEMLIAISERSKARSDELGRRMADNDIEEIAAELTGEIVTDGVVFGSMVTSGDTVTVSLEDSEARPAGKAEGVSDKGSIDAGCKAVNKMTGFAGDIVEWSGISKSRGAAAAAGIYVTVAQNGNRVEAYAEDERGVDAASIKAYIKAIGLIERSQARLATTPSTENAKTVVAA